MKSSTNMLTHFDPSACSTLVEVLHKRALSQPDQHAYTFLMNGEAVERRLTYAELDKRARAIGAALQEICSPGERALLLYPFGIDFVFAFFGCLYAGIVAVPAYPPSNNRSLQRIQAIATDAQAAVALTTQQILTRVEPQSPSTELRALKWIATDQELDNQERWQEPQLSREKLCFLQYTSGSTGIPKGVMVSHGNLMHNSAMMCERWKHTPASINVSWLPVFHDMGLIAGILQPLYVGFLGIVMAPTAFLQRPLSWLQAISRYRGTTSWAPNFAYEMCTRRANPEELSMLDLSSWRIAGNGAEPVREETLKRFVQTFAPYGFRQEVFTPGYGLAEGTLMVSSVSEGVPPAIVAFDKTQIEQHHVMTATTQAQIVLTSCGPASSDQKIVIVQPETKMRCRPDEVGEIWVAGPSVAQGYWKRTEETREVFQAYLADTGEGPFLRTGDLGFIYEDELFVTGRCKDLIIIRGRNLYPQDIELAVEQCHSALRPGCGAAFSIDVADEERLIIVQEVRRDCHDFTGVIAAIRQTITEQFEVGVYAIVLITHGSILKTSSGKIQRKACRSQFLADTLSVVIKDIIEEQDLVQETDDLNRALLLTAPPDKRSSLLEASIMRQLQSVLRMKHLSVTPQTRISALGLDSLNAADLKNRLENDFVVDIPLIGILHGATISQLATHILAILDGEGSDEATFSLSHTNDHVDAYPLSSWQEQLWFLYRLAPENPFYNVSIALRLQGKLQVRALESSLREIIQRHEVLRTVFFEEKDTVLQRSISSVSVNIAIISLEMLSVAACELEAHKQAALEARKPFDLSNDVPIRLLLLRLHTNEHIVVVTLHHIVCDAQSMIVLGRELSTFYKDFCRGRAPVLATQPIQYGDYALWQRQWLRSKFAETQRSYWIHQLASLPVLALPTDRRRPLVQSYRGACVYFTLPHELRQGLSELSRQEEVTLFMTLLAAFLLLLARYTGQTEIVVGTPVSQRNHVKLEGLIGFFVNVLVLRVDLAGISHFRALMQCVRSIGLDAYAHQDLPFQQLVEELKPERDLSRGPLCQVIFTLQEALTEHIVLPELNTQVFNIDNATSKIDMHLTIIDDKQGLTGKFEYSTDLFDAATIERTAGHFRTLLEGIVASPEQRLSEVPFLTPAERQQLLFDWNPQPRPFSAPICLHHLFEQQVELASDRVAVTFQETSLSYSALNYRANQLAHYLQSLGQKPPIGVNSQEEHLFDPQMQNLGVGPNILVGIMMERSLEVIIGILAILKAGGAFVPLDPAYPQERLTFMLQDAQLSIMLSQERLIKRLPEHNARVVCLDVDWETIAKESITNPFSEGSSDTLAYVIYTSGSTGRPKGVMVLHRGVCNLAEAQKLAFHLQSEEHILQFASLSFDASIWEIVMAWGAGATLCLASQEDLLPGPNQVALLQKQAITCVTLPPSVLSAWSPVSFPALHTIISAGEACSSRLIELWGDGRRFFNAYGPTETTVCATVALCPEKSTCVSIGRPLANTQVYLLDAHMQPVPIGLIGELYVGGDSLALGYLNRPEQTAERFVAHPLSTRPGMRLYKTGDLARYRNDTTLEFLGRVDTQVKLRGYRIELGEIEEALKKHPAVDNATVMFHDHTGEDTYLLAYISSPFQEKPTTNNLRDFLLSKLPAHMIPTKFLVLDTLPLMPNGKVDRHVLSQIETERVETAATYVPPQKAIEKAIARIWQEVLEIEKVGIYDNFFDLGGHSLLLGRIHEGLHAVLDKEVSMVDLFTYPTISSLIDYLNQEQGEEETFQQSYNRAETRRVSVSRHRRTIQRSVLQQEQDGAQDE